MPNEELLQIPPGVKSAKSKDENIQKLELPVIGETIGNGFTSTITAGDVVVHPRTVLEYVIAVCPVKTPVTIPEAASIVAFTGDELIQVPATVCSNIVIVEPTQTLSKPVIG